MKTIIVGLLVMVALGGCASERKPDSCPVTIFPAKGGSGPLGATDCVAAPLPKNGK